MNKLKLMSTTIIMVLIVLYMILLSQMRPAKAYGIYYMPIVIQEQSGNDLVNHSIKIELNSTNFNNWDDILYDDGSDIYFTDTSKNPLYYWIESFNRTSKEATIWVRVPFVPANGSASIYMFFGGTNPYLDYCDSV